MVRPRFTESLDLAAVATAVSCSRMFVELTLERWGASAIVDDTLLVVSELVTAAVRETGIADPRPSWSQLDSLRLIRVNLIGFEHAVVIKVWDAKGLPAQSGTDANAMRRGRSSVVEVAHRYGMYPRGRGKVVWVELLIAPRSAQTSTAEQLPRRPQRTVLGPRQPIPRQQDPEILQQVLDGLRRLGKSSED